jgi:ADP-heptose:LPS heptosyltransferase
MELQAQKRSFKQQWQIVRALRREKFDVAFNFNGADRTIFMTALTGARFRVGYPGGRKHFWNSWLVPHWAPRQDPNQVVFEQRRSVLAACGIALGTPRFNLRLDETIRAWATQLVPRFAIHISINSAKPTREWPLEHYRDMLRLVWAKLPGLTVLVSSAAAARERQRLREFMALVGDQRLQALPEVLSIPQLAAVLKLCRLHIGPDSGVLHLAVALDVPSVSFFREQGAFKSFMPIGGLHQVIAVPCHCIDHSHAPCEQLGLSECFAQIQPSRVAQLVCGALTPLSGNLSAAPVPPVTR